MPTAAATLHLFGGMDELEAAAVVLAMDGEPNAGQELELEEASAEQDGRDGQISPFEVSEVQKVSINGEPAR